MGLNCHHLLFVYWIIVDRVRNRILCDGKSQVTWYCVEFMDPLDFANCEKCKLGFGLRSISNPRPHGTVYYFRLIETLWIVRSGERGKCHWYGNVSIWILCFKRNCVLSLLCSTYLLVLQFVILFSHQWYKFISLI